MKISEAKECIVSLYDLENCVTALISERGIGKTSAYKQCSDELDIGYIDLYAAALEGPDFMGLPDRDRENGITKYLAPQFLPTIEAVREGIYPSRGILVLEEINRVPSDTISVLYPLLLDRKINGHTLADGWRIGVTMNPDTMNYLVNSLDDAMLDRFIAIEVEADLDDYISYSLKTNPNDDVLSFLQAFPGFLLMTKKAGESTVMTKSPTPRGWSKVQEVMNHVTLKESLIKELVAGIVGPHATASLFGFLNNRDIKLPDVKILLTDYNLVRDDVLKLTENSRIDLLQYTLKKVANTFEFKLHQESMTNFLSDLPEELQVLFFKHVLINREDTFDDLMALPVYDKISDYIADVMVS